MQQLFQGAFASAGLRQSGPNMAGSFVALVFSSRVAAPRHLSFIIKSATAPPPDVRHHVHRPDMVYQTSHHRVFTAGVHESSHGNHDQLDMKMQSPEDQQV